jgi:hypothetical protein
MAKPFKGKIDLDIRDSTPDWDAFLPDKAPDGAPNVLVVLYDDTGLAAWSPFGGGIEMPTLQRLADNGLTTDYGETKFSGKVNWAEIELGLDDHDLISPEERLSVAMAIQ